MTMILGHLLVKEVGDLELMFFGEYVIRRNLQVKYGQGMFEVMEEAGYPFDV